MYMYLGLAVSMIPQKPFFAFFGFVNVVWLKDVLDPFMIILFKVIQK